MAQPTRNSHHIFPIIPSKAVKSDPAFKENVASWVALLGKFEKGLQWAASKENGIILGESFIYWILIRSSRELTVLSHRRHHARGMLSGQLRNLGLFSSFFSFSFPFLCFSFFCKICTDNPVLQLRQDFINIR